MAEPKKFVYEAQKGKDAEMCKTLLNLFKTLRSLSVSNMEHYQTGVDSYQARFHVAFCLIYEHLELGVEPATKDIVKKLHRYDAYPGVPANGYRSILRITQKCCLHLLQLTRHISINKDSMFFRSAHYCKELESYVTALGQLRACLYYSQKLIFYCDDGDLFASEEKLDTESEAEQLMMEVEKLSQNCFYGRCLGFQFCESMLKPLQVVSIAMASFSEGYQETSNIMQLASSLFNSRKYLMNPELRAQQVVTTTRTADINFCKAFWSITESDILHQLPGLMCPAVAIDEIIQLKAKSFEVALVQSEKTVVITPPCAHTGPGPVNVRLISYQLREGQDPDNKFNKPGNSNVKKVLPKSPYLLIHCHGGGFVAQSSKSHEVYLRHWAKELDVPILSIDYSLAPENPFPRALEDCFFAYAWAINNCHRLGSTAERICLAGDSAGGNLMTSTLIRAISVGIRLPDGIMAAYTPFNIRYTPSPSRLFSLMDPLLPVGILSRCLAAYAGVSDQMKGGLFSPKSASNNEDLQRQRGSERQRCSVSSVDSDDWVVLGESDVEKDMKFVKNGQSEKIGKKSMFESSAKIAQNNRNGNGRLESTTNTDSISQSTDMPISNRNNTSANYPEHSSKVTTTGSVMDHIASEYASSTLEFDAGVSRSDELIDSIAASKEDVNSHLDTDSDDDEESTGDTFYDTSETMFDANGMDTELDTKLSEHTDCSLNTKNKWAKVTFPGRNETDKSLDNSNRHTGNHKVNGNCDISSQVKQTRDNDAQNELITSKKPNLHEPVPMSMDRRHLSLSLDSSMKNLSSKSKSAPPRPPPPNLSRTPSTLASPMVPPPNLSRTPSTLASPMVPLFADDKDYIQSPLHVFRHLPIIKNPFMSPLLAPDAWLKKLPDVYLVACEFDPVLDDSVSFARKLHSLGKFVHLTVIRDLPHGFLNFALLSKEAKTASDKCVEKIKLILKCG